MHPAIDRFGDKKGQGEGMPWKGMERIGSPETRADPLSFWEVYCGTAV